MRLYLAGPMAGVPDENFPAFDAARDAIRALGHTVVSPADLTREKWALFGGRDRLLEAITTDQERRWLFYKQDLQAVLTCEGIVLLDGWATSRGATLEALVAAELGLVFYLFRRNELKAVESVPGDSAEFTKLHLAAEQLLSHEYEPRDCGGACVVCGCGKHVGSTSGAPKGDPAESICLEADRLVDGTRQREYGHPLDNFTDVAALWRQYLEAKWRARGRRLSADDDRGPVFTLVHVPLEAEDVAMMQLLVKVARLENTPTHRDSAVDIAGYAKCLDLITNERARRVGGAA